MPSNRQRPLTRTIALFTAISTGWLVISPAIAFATEPARRSKPTGHTRALTTAEMARLFGAQQTSAVIATPGSGIPQAWQGPIAGGNKVTMHPVVSWKQRGGMPISLAFLHSSIGQTNNTVGKKWTHTYNVYLVLPSTSGGNIQAVFGDGRGETFVQNVSGTYDATAGIYDKLVVNSGGTYTITRKDLTVWQFNSNGFLTSITDKNGNATTLSYSTGGMLQSVTDATGRQLTFTWDTLNNRITNITDPAGRVWDLGYDSSGNLQNVTDPAASIGAARYVTSYSYDFSNRITQKTDRRGKAWTFSYDTSDRIVWERTPLLDQTSYSYTSATMTITDARGHSSVYTYNTNGEQTGIQDESGFTETYTYDLAHNKIGVVDKRGKTWSYTFDNRGNMLTKTNPLGKTWTWTYTPKDQAATVTTPLGYSTVLTHDTAGNVLTVSNPLGDTTSLTVGSYGLVTQIIDATSKHISNSYDSNGNVVTQSTPVGSVSYTCSVLGWVTSVTDPTNLVTSYIYDSLGRLTSVTEPGNRNTTQTFNAENRLLTSTNAIGKVYSHSYDDAGRLVSQTNPLNRVVTYGYDENGNRTTFTDGRGKVTTYSFTNRNELSNILYPDATNESYSYNAAGAFASKTDGRGVTTTFSYDDAGQQTLINYPSGTADVTFAYDDDGRKTSMVDGTGTTTYAYDNAGRVTSRATPQGTVNYSYDDAGRVSSRTLVGTGVTSFSYDAAGRISSVSDSGDTVSYTYDAAGRRLNTTYPNGTTEGNGYDSGTGEVLFNAISDGTNLISVKNYQYDALGRKISSDTNGVDPIFYGYDDAGELNAESRTGSNGYSIAYSYDNAGNRLSKTYTPTGGTTTTELYTYDDANKMLTAGSKSYSYDNAGNVTSVTSGSNVTTVAWDAAGRMTGITYPSSATNSFVYNGLSQRVGKTDSTGTFSMTLADDAIDTNVLSDGAAVYRRGLNMFGEIRGGNKSYYHSDAIGTDRAVIDSTGTVTATLATDAFGNKWTPGTTGSAATPFGFAGQYGYQTDADSGLMMLGHRFYDPSTGRFLSRDPIQDGDNWYIYCDNDPVNHVDPEGLDTVKVGGTVIQYPPGITPITNGDGSVTIPGAGKYYPRPGGGVSVIPIPGKGSGGGGGNAGGGGGNAGGGGGNGDLSLVPDLSWGPFSFPAERVLKRLPKDRRIDGPFEYGEFIIGEVLPDVVREEWRKKPKYKSPVEATLDFLYGLRFPWDKQ